MLPKEIVLRAIEFRHPPRIPVHYCNRDLDSSDTYTVGWDAANGFIPSQPGQSEWGFIWHSLDQTMGQPEGHPLADWDKLDTYVPPDPFAPAGWIILRRPWPKRPPFYPFRHRHQRVQHRHLSYAVTRPF